MSLELRWVGQADLERVAQARMLCYAHAGKEIERLRAVTREDPRAVAGDFLIADQQGQPVGTATSLSMTMWVRGGAIPCQGVAWVGTVKTHRRRNNQGPGIATRIMQETLRLGREREEVVSALMPFRASFYEHFGYGLVECRSEWTTPLAVLPTGNFDGIDLYHAEVLPELIKFRQRTVQSSQCDIERPESAWAYWLKQRGEAGFVAVDQPDPHGPIRGYLAFEHQQIASKDVLRVMQMSYEDTPALLRQLHFLASLRDQYQSAVMILPPGLPLNRLLRETQLPHRLVNHAHAEVRQDTRMQVRILDHKRFLEALYLPKQIRGKTVVSILESEGNEIRILIDIADGRATVRPSSAEACLACRDHIWAAIGCGTLSATGAMELGLAKSENPRDAELLDALSIGPPPFSHEYF